MSALKRSLRIDLSRVQINTNKAVILHYLSTFQKILDFSRVFCYCRLSDNSNLGAEQSTPRNGGEGGTRTLAPVTRPTPLAGAPRHQLEYFSMVTSKKDEIVYIKRERLRITFWRREWDSNPRCLAARRFSRPFRYDHFGISPCGTEAIITQFAMLVNSFL